MARKPRYHISDGFYHVMLRGNNGQPIFFHDEERCRMFMLLEEGIVKYGHRIHAFCLMTNHIHLLIQVGEIPLSRIIHNLAFRYTQFINRRHKKIGHLFQGRFKAILIQEKAYFLRLLRYIHMNPMRACLVKRLEAYRWSSHGAYLGNCTFKWLTTEYGLRKFADRMKEARLKYREYVLQQELDENIKELSQGFDDGQILGDDNFLQRARETRYATSPSPITLDIILEATSQVYAVDKLMLTSSLRSKRVSLARGAAMAFARQEKYSFEQVAKALKRDSSTLNRLLQNFLRKLAGNVEAQNEFQHLKKHAKVMQEVQA